MDFWRLWTSSALSNLADGVLKVSLPLVALDLTRSPVLIAGLTFAFTLPWLLFALPAGVVVDRVDRRLLMVGANLARAGLVACALLADSLWLLYAVAVGVGVAETLYDTAAQSVVPRLVARTELPRANGRLYAAELTANELVGPPLAGFLVAASALALGAPAAVWVVAAVVLLFLRGSFRAERPLGRTTVRADVVAGLRFVWRDRVLRRCAVGVGVFNFAGAAREAVLVLYATTAMGLSARGFGLLLGAFAAGSLLGSLVAARVHRRFAARRILLVAFVGAAALIGVPTLTADPYAVGAAFLVSGAAVVVANVVVVSMRQAVTPDALLGRVTSGFRVVGWGAKPLGAIAGGVLAQVLGVRAVFAVVGLFAVVVLAAVMSSARAEDMTG